MQQKFTGNSIQSTIRQAVERDSATTDNRSNQETEKKYRIVSAHALPLAWGPWTEIWTQIGVVGPNRDQHVSQIRLSFHATSRGQSSFDVEIRGGDRFIRTIGPGSATVTVTGNVATAISVRYRSHSTLLKIATSVQSYKVHNDE